MTLQSAIGFAQAYGVPGELRFDGPTRSEPGLLASADAANNVFGRVFTSLPTNPGVWRAGNADGLGTKWAIMIDPKEHASYGTVAGGPLAPTLTIPNGKTAGMCTMGFIVGVTDSAARPGDIVRFLKTTGALHVVPPGTAADPLYEDLPTAKADRVEQPNVPGLFVLRLTQ